MKESCWMPYNSGQSFTSQKLKYRAENTKQAHRHPPQDDFGLPTITIRFEFLYLHPLKSILLLRNCSRPLHFKQSLKAWSNVASNWTRTVIWCVDKIWTSWIIVVYYMDNSTSNNIQSQDGNFRITSKNWKKRLLPIFRLNFIKRLRQGNWPSGYNRYNMYTLPKVRRSTTLFQNGRARANPALQWKE